ncbi:hypothetical protein J7439_10170 [Salinisphaera sp. G21_0]|nr:hypothetical protein [Salinisphaera sp. G21_0]
MAITGSRITKKVSKIRVLTPGLSEPSFELMLIVFSYDDPVVDRGELHRSETIISLLRKCEWCSLAGVAPLVAIGLFCRQKLFPHLKFAFYALSSILRRSFSTNSDVHER